MSDSNPYAPPKSRVGEPVSAGLSEAPPEARLYSQNQIATATFLGSPLVGGWLIAANHKALARPEQANRAIILGVGGTVLLLGLAMVLPDRFPNAALPAACAVAVRAWANAQFSTVIEHHRAAGGVQFSWWRVVGLSLLSAAIIFTCLFIVVMALYSFGILSD